MTTAKKIASNQANASKSTGPKTATGKETSAGNAFKHGMTATNPKYLAPGENPEEFALHYAMRRVRHPAEDPIIDDLVRKITLIHWRINRAFQAEAVMLESTSLDELFVDYRAPVKNLNAYVAANRKLLQTLRDELATHEKAAANRKLPQTLRDQLAAYEKAEAQRRATSSMPGDAATPREPPPTEPPPAVSTSNTPMKEEPIGMPVTVPDLASSAPSSDAAAPKKAPISKDASTAATAAAEPTTPVPAATPRTTKPDPNSKTNPNSMKGGIPGAPPAPAPPQPSIYQAKFDLPTWGNAR